MKVLCDANISRRTAAALTAAGHDAIHSTERLAGSAPDADVARVAVDEQRLVVTFDSDIPTLVALGGGATPSVVHLRTTSAAPDMVTAVVLAVLRDCEKSLRRGAIVVVEDRRTRVRDLPVASADSP